MTVNRLKEALASLLGLPQQAVVEDNGMAVRLTNMAFKELRSLVNLPDGYKLTARVGKPDKGDYFLDVESLVSNERVVIYRATGEVKAVNIILARVQNSPTTVLRDFDFLVCMLQGGQALYKGKTVLVTAPVIDATKKVAILNNGEYKLVSVSDLSNMGNPPPSETNLWNFLPDREDDEDDDYYKFGKPNPHHNRFNLEFDDEGYDPFFGLN